jgi:hypothetical protein
MSYYIAPLAPQMVPLRCRGIIAFVGAAGLGLMLASDGKPIGMTNCQLTSHSYCYVVQ